MEDIFKSQDNTEAPKVFISYSYDSKQHEEWVENLANKLRSCAGVNAIIDKFVLNQANDLLEIMNQGFQNSDKVIIVATEGYVNKAKQRESGVKYELGLADILNKCGEKEKLIFITKDKTDFNSVLPFQFKGRYVIDFSETSFDRKFKELYYKIWNKNYTNIAPIGQSPFENKTASNLIDISAKNIYDLFDENGFEWYNLTHQNITSDSPVIWPVVPRSRVNIIHFAQIEVARVLAQLGCTLKVIIANCGNNSGITPSKEDLAFKNKIEEILKKKQISQYEISFLNEYYDPSFRDGTLILSMFAKISSSITISKLSNFNTKDASYDNQAISKIQDRTTLKYISPILNWTASVYEAEKMSNGGSGSPIIIAGADERSQWAHVFTRINAKIGAVFIPILKQEDDKTICQDTQNLFFSKTELQNKFGTGNIDKWLFQTFVFLPAFPRRVLYLESCKKNSRGTCNRKKSCNECLFPDNANKFPSFIDKGKFANLIYPKINPA